MKNVKFLHTSAGTYGLATEGDELTLQDSHAAQLEKQGVVKVTGDAGKDAEESVAEKGSLRINDLTAKATPAAGETDHKNPTGADKPAPKATPLKSTKKGKK
jgi:hypothetical protein